MMLCFARRMATVYLNISHILGSCCHEDGGMLPSSAYNIATVWCLKFVNDAECYH